MSGLGTSAIAASLAAAVLFAAAPELLGLREAEAPDENCEVCNA